MQKFDYYSTDEEISWIASKVFSDEHYGSALTEDELQQRLEMEEDYKDEKTRNEQFQILKENGHTLSFEWDDILKIGLKKKEIGSIKDVAKSTFSKRDCEIDSKIITLD